VRRGRQSRRSRRRARVLGQFVRRRSVRRSDRARQRHRRRDARRRMRPRQNRAGPPQLALPARSPHRRLHRPDAPLSFVAVTAIPPEHRRLLAAYRMPAEWEQHLACYLAWPHNRDTWPGKFEVIPPIYAEMVAKIARFEPVRLAVTDASQIDEVRAMIREAARRTETEAPGPLLPIDVFHLPTNDAWARDHGPIFVNRLAN